MPFVGTGHLWLIGIILVIVLIIWGPGKLPDVGSGLGRAIREFRKASADTKAEFHKATAPEATVAPVAEAPVATAPVTPVAQPAAVGGGPTAVPTEHVATEGDHTAAS